jgi:UDP-3-O-[3-hydroxymyristoyl] glucosamine N-acyltransferase
MSDPVFFRRPDALSLADISVLAGATLAQDTGRRVDGVASLDRAGPRDLAFCDSPKYRSDLIATRAAACLVTPRLQADVPAGTAALVTPEPSRSFSAVARALYPVALKPQSVFGSAGLSPGAHIHPAARLEANVTVDPGAVIGPEAEIGQGTVICAQAVIGPGVRIGRDSAIGPGASLTHALLGDRVIVHAGARIGQDGFGYTNGARHIKLPQLGRVIIQDDVEIGAGTTIDRGYVRDTMIGEGTKIDNLVQIAHNVVIGRHCIVVAQCGIAGSATLEDFVVLGAKVGVIGHVTVGEGAQIAATSAVNDDVPARARWGGVPAQPVREWFRQIAEIRRLGRAGGKVADPSTQGE